MVFLAQRERPLQLSGVEVAAAEREAASGERVAMPSGGLFGRYRVAVGRNQGVQPKNLVGAIANEGGVDRGGIGRITLHDDYSIVELPVGLSAGVLSKIGRIRVLQHALDIRPYEGGADSGMDSQVKRRPRPEGEVRAPRGDRFAGAGAAGGAPSSGAGTGAPKRPWDNKKTPRKFAKE